MDVENTDKLIGRAIAALPYHSPSAGFSARVMAGIAEAGEQIPWFERVFEAVGSIVSAWMALLVFVFASLVYANLADLAALFIQPGGLTQMLNQFAAGAVLALLKLTAIMSFGFEILSVAVSGLLSWHEIAAAALICSAAVAALSKSGGVSVQKAGI
jgi:hypothetical protein